MTATAATLERAFVDHRRYLWGVCYRMTGCAADADDLVQETFERAMTRPPPDTTAPWRPWLVRVAINLAKDALRRRRRRGYEGSWLPSPIEAGDERLVAATEADDTAGRYDLLESVSFAFLLALEALTPQQRAVLVLRDVLDYSGRETAETLGIGEANVKTTLHRARRAMRAYEAAPARPTPEARARTERALAQLVHKLAARDADGLAALLAGDVHAVSDGGGEFLAARVPVVGAAKVATFYANLARGRAAPTRVDFRVLNGWPAVVIEIPPAGPRLATRMVIRADVDEQGRVIAIHTVLASRKLTHVRFGS